jgi:hypothetical protein
MFLLLTVVDKSKFRDGSLEYSRRQTRRARKLNCNRDESETPNKKIRHTIVQSARLYPSKDKISCKFSIEMGNRHTLKSTSTLYLSCNFYRLHYVNWHLPECSCNDHKPPSDLGLLEEETTKYLPNKVLKCGGIIVIRN